MTSTPPAVGADPVATLKLVVAHLAAARSCALRATADAGDVALGAELLIWQALQLIPAGESLEDLPAPVSTDVTGLLLQAQRLLLEAQRALRAHPVQVFPPGAAELALSLRDLIAEARA